MACPPPRHGQRKDDDCRGVAQALAQIKGRDYAGKYALSGKRITLVGISFSAEKRTIVEELVEELPAS